MPTEPRTSNDVHLWSVTAEQISYHLRMAAVFGIAGQPVESASEALLAWTLLSLCWKEANDDALRTGEELVDQHVAPLSAGHRAAAHGRARAQALDLEGHFVSVGRHAEANLYALVAADLDETVESLVRS